MNILTHFENIEKAREYVTACESTFRKRCDECVKRVLSQDGLKIITLSGPTCSGKTTAAHMLVRELERAGHDVEVISIDDFFYDRQRLNMREKLDYDSVETIDLELLQSVACGIEHGERVKLPIFDFMRGERVGYRDFAVSDNTVTLFEGIQAVYPEVSCMFDKKDTCGIYISVQEDMHAEDMTVDARTVRLMRRLLRDSKKRSSSICFTLRLWQSVCENEDRAILPYEHTSDIRLNSLIGYELSLLKEPLLPLLGAALDDGIHTGRINELRELLLRVDAIEASLVPQDSLLREFI